MFQPAMLVRQAPIICDIIYPMIAFRPRLGQAVLCAALLSAAWVIAACASEPPPTATPVPAQPTATHTPVPTAAPTAAPIPPTAAPRPTPIPTREPATPVRTAPRPATQPPEAAHDFEVETFDGETLRLSDLEGKVVVLNFWASWCPPCRWEMPAFERISQEYGDEGVVFVGIALTDTLRAAKEFADSAGVTYPLALDKTGEIARAYNVVGLPTTFFIDREGMIQRRLTSVANEGVLKIFIRGQLNPTPSRDQ